MGIAQFFGLGCEPKATPENPVFVRNIGPWETARAEIKGGVLGAPKASGLDGIEHYTAERNAQDGYQGVYRTGPSRNFEVLRR